MTFEEYLQDVHAKDYIGTDDDMFYAFGKWLGELEADDWFKNQEEYERVKYGRT